MLGLIEFMREIGFHAEDLVSIIMDNWAATKQPDTDGSMSSVKHVVVRMKFIFGYASEDIVKLKFVELRHMNGRTYLR